MSKHEKVVSPILAIEDDKVREAYLEARGYSPEVRKWFESQTKNTRATINSVSLKESERRLEMLAQGAEGVMSARLRSAYWLAANRWQAERKIWRLDPDLQLASCYLAMVDLLSPLSFKGDKYHMLTSNYWSWVLPHGYLLQPLDDFDPAQLVNAETGSDWGKADYVKHFQQRGYHWFAPLASPKFSLGRVRESSVPKPFRKSLAKPKLAVREGALHFSLPKDEVRFVDHTPKLRGAWETPMIERHAEVDVTSITPLPWRYLLAKKALEMLEGLEESAWFVPEGEPSEWGAFLMQTLKDGLEPICPRVMFGDSDDALAFLKLRNAALKELQLGQCVDKLAKQREIDFATGLADGSNVL